MVYVKDLPEINYLVLNPADNIGILVFSGGLRGQALKCLNHSEGMIRLKGQVPKGHKIAIRKIKNNQPIIKSGQIIGIASKNIDAGEHAHVHNIRFSDKISFSVKDLRNPLVLSDSRKDALPNHFNGFLREDGRAGVRNYILVVSTVNCSASVTKEIAAYFKNKDLSKQGIDGVIPITHQSGCALSENGYTYKLLNRALAGYLTHPNVVGSVIMGLGCEMITCESISSVLDSGYKSGKVCREHINIQDAGGTKKSIKLGIQRVEKLLSKLPVFKRRELPVSLLNLALKCGGSDAFSALTANPALGKASDMLVSLGGTAIMGELPECFGGEGILLKRCLRKADENKLKNLFSWWSDYTKRNNVVMNDNISLGNIKGGISTILEKSIGAIAKGGVSPISEVVDYAQRNTRKGLIFMNTP
ncbi:MAG: UxaA family hydrolase, partial [Candidatus Omnitrophota bacterium]